MCHRIALGVVPCVRLATSGSYCRADIRSRANVRPRTFALTPAALGAAARVRVHPSVESVLRHPIRHSHIRP
ncbi:hypothetical protein CFB43_21070 [Burkholderia sp. AU15512]|nr:hypothetical protein CFB43_21070 [Burkholderia sp. AU15512]